MKVVKLILVACTLTFFFTCKKTVNTAQTNNKFGTIYGFGGAQTLSGVVETNDKGYVLYGYTNASGNGSIDGFVMRLDEQLNLKWYKKIMVENGLIK